MKLFPKIVKDKLNPSSIYEDQGFVTNAMHLRFGPDRQHSYCRVYTLISGVLYWRHHSTFWDWPCNFEPHVSRMKKLINWIKAM